MKWYIRDGVLSKSESEGAAVFEAEDNATAVVIPEGVTEIGERAFGWCGNLASITLPAGVTRIGENAFEWCMSLTSIILPEGVTRIGKGVFWNCDSLTSITLPEGLTEIGESAFWSCHRLTSITLPAGVTRIGHSAFSWCSSLTSIAIPEGVTAIDKDAFRGCSSLTSIILPEGVTRIDENAFNGCSSLSSITLPEGVTKIGWRAFSGCGSLSSITIPDSVTVIGKYAFDDETQIHIRHLNVLPAKLQGRARFVYVMDGRDLTTEIGKQAAKYVRAHAGENAQWLMRETKLLQALLREKLIAAKDIDAFHAAAREKGDVEMIAQLLDYQTNVLTTAKVVKARARQAKKQKQMIDRAAARANKKDLVGLVFVVAGKLETFENRDELKAYLEKCGAKLASSVTTKTDYLVANDTSTDSEKNKKAISLGVDVIDEKRLNKILHRKFNVVREAYIPDSAIAILPHAFEKCRTLTRITIPASVTEIGTCAFMGCTSLADVTLLASVTEIEDFTFDSCTSLTSVTLPASVTRIGHGAFAGCTRLTSVTLPASVTKIESGAFAGCTRLTNITIRPGNPAYKSVDGCIFDQSGKVLVGYPACPRIYTVPAGVAEIGDFAFTGCKRLTAITLPDSVTKIGVFAFDGCKELVIHAPAGSYAESYAKENSIPFEPV